MYYTVCQISRALDSFARSYRCQIVGCEIAAANDPLIEHHILIRLMLLLVGLISVERKKVV